jgi:hypothetical protein
VGRDRPAPCEYAHGIKPIGTFAVVT